MKADTEPLQKHLSWMCVMPLSSASVPALLAYTLKKMTVCKAHNGILTDYTLLQLDPACVSVVLLAGGVGKRMGVRSASCLVRHFKHADRASMYHLPCS